MLQAKKPVTSIKNIYIYIYEVSALQIKRVAEASEAMRGTTCNVNKVKQMETKRRKSHQNYFCLIESHGVPNNALEIHLSKKHTNKAKLSGE